MWSNIRRREAYLRIVTISIIATIAWTNQSITVTSFIADIIPLHYAAKHNKLHKSQYYIL